VKDAVEVVLPVRTVESEIAAMMSPPFAMSRDNAIGLKLETSTAFPDAAPRTSPLVVAMIRPWGVVERVHGVGVRLRVTPLEADRKRFKPRFRSRYCPTTHISQRPR
jgi:hypothetical protein